MFTFFKKMKLCILFLLLSLPVVADHTEWVVIKKEIKLIPTGKPPSSNVAVEFIEYHELYLMSTSDSTIKYFLVERDYLEKRIHDENLTEVLDPIQKTCIGYMDINILSVKESDTVLIYLPNN